MGLLNQLTSLARVGRTPELAHVDRDARIAAARRVRNRSLRDPVIWLMWAGYAGFLVVAFFIGQWYFGSAYNVLRLPVWAVMPAVMLIAGFAGWLPLALYERHLLRRRLRRHFPGEVCAGCGYNLTGVESGRCPECGRGFRTTDP